MENQEGITLISLRARLVSDWVVRFMLIRNAKTYPVWHLTQKKLPCHGMQVISIASHDNINGYLFLSICYLGSEEVICSRDNFTTRSQHIYLATLPACIVYSVTRFELWIQLDCSVIIESPGLKSLFVSLKLLLLFSELVSCDKVDQGCEGGLPSDAYKQIIKLGGKFLCYQRFNCQIYVLKLYIYLFI